MPRPPGNSAFRGSTTSRRRFRGARGDRERGRDGDHGDHAGGRDPRTGTFLKLFTLCGGRRVLTLGCRSAGFWGPRLAGGFPKATLAICARSLRVPLVGSDPARRG